MKITTARLVLREFVEEDWIDMLAYQQKQDYLRYYEWHERRAGDVRDLVALFLKYQQDVPRYKFQFAVTSKAAGSLIGSCGIRKASPKGHEAEIGFEINPDYWGRGYATEAAETIVTFGFSELGLHRIWAWCIAENSGSRRLLEKLGMRQEARLRDKEYFKNRWWDVLYFAILEDEWQER